MLGTCDLLPTWHEKGRTERNKWPVGWVAQQGHFHYRQNDAERLRLSRQRPDGLGCKMNCRDSSHARRPLPTPNKACSLPSIPVLAVPGSSLPQITGKRPSTIQVSSSGFRTDCAPAHLVAMFMQQLYAPFGGFVNHPLGG